MVGSVGIEFSSVGSSFGVTYITTYIPKFAEVMGNPTAGTKDGVIQICGSFIITTNAFPTNSRIYGGFITQVILLDQKKGNSA